jgi:DNA-binding NtrC family response regulator/tetratricopeptide (TPR) repeat protein
MAREHAIEAVVSARRCGSRVVEALALGTLGRLERSRCRWSNAEEAIRASLNILEQVGNIDRVGEMRQSLGIVLWKRGRLDDALECVRGVLENDVRQQRGRLRWYASLLQGMILVHVGKFREASEIFSSGTEWENSGSEVRPSLLTTEFLGDVHLEQGQAEQALRHYDDVWPKALALVPKGDIVAELRRRRAECYLLLGRASEAYEEAQTGLAHCRELGDRYEEAATYRVLALAAAAIGRPQEAKQHFTQGFAYYDDIETPYEWGKLWMAYGDWLRGPHAAEYSDARGALEAYHAARDHFERMGAQAKLAEANARIAEQSAIFRPEHPTLRASSAVAQHLTGTPPSSDPAETRRPQRRPRGAAELDRRSRWAIETFGLVTRNPHLLSLLEDVAKLARGSAPILVLGESGTGKELIAAGIHRLSGRRGQYMPLNSSAVPREVIENELFGHVAGGFTGATQGKAGLFEVCDGGTVFLDEVGEMPLELQAKLLRFLESGELRRVGATRNVAVDTRVVAATNRERGALERGEGLRKDLYYRLAHAIVELPALRHRGEDLELLVDHFLAEACADEEKHVTLSAAARRRLLTYAWPGNIRQMKAVVRRVVTLTSDGHSIGVAELKLEDTSVPTTLLEELGEAEKRRVAEVLRQVGGSRTEAAKLLGVPRTTLLNKMRRYGLS